MFEREDLLDFVNVIINQSTGKEETKYILTEFMDYLDLAKLTDPDTLSELEQIISCTDEVISIKEKLGSCDIHTLVDGAKEKIEVKEKKRTPRETVHYHHYHYSYEPSSYSSSCSGGGSYSSSC